MSVRRILLAEDDARLAEPLRDFLTTTAIALTTRLDRSLLPEQHLRVHCDGIALR
jgi:hypothetical protein